MKAGVIPAYDIFAGCLVKRGSPPHRPQNDRWLGARIVYVDEGPSIFGKLLFRPTESMRFGRKGADEMVFATVGEAG